MSTAPRSLRDAPVNGYGRRLAAGQRAARTACEITRGAPLRLARAASGPMGTAAAGHLLPRHALIRTPGPQAQILPTRYSRECSAKAAAAAASGAADEPPQRQLDTLQQHRHATSAVKIASLGSLFFCSTFIYTILQNLKDSIVVTRSGAEVLPFLEAYGVLPVSVGFFILYRKLHNWLPERWVYPVALAPFLAFYTLFAAVLYPLADVLHPTHLLDSMRAALPAGFVGLASMVVNWTYSLFFVMGELWGGVAISLLFWGLADDVCTISEAETVYPLLGIIANVGLVLAGAWIKAVNAAGASLAAAGVVPLQVLIGTVLAIAAALVLLQQFVFVRYVKQDPAHGPTKASTKKDKEATKVKAKSLRESLASLKQSPKVSNLAVLVVAYFIAQKLFDFAWKAQLRVLYPSPEACQQVLAEVAQWTGVSTIALMSCSKLVFRFGGWAAAALATPVAVLVSGGVFFASAIAMQGGAAALGPQAVAWLLAAAGIAGAVGRVATRAPKYSLFDPAKEMVYISMAKEEKTEAKATIDLLASYFGKSGASWIMQALVLGLGSMTAAMPFLAAVHLCVSVAWTRSTYKLAKVMHKEQKAGREREAAAWRAQAAGDPQLGGPDAGQEDQPSGLGPSSDSPPGGQSSHAPPTGGNGDGKGGNGHSNGHDSGGNGKGALPVGHGGDASAGAAGPGNADGPGVAAEPAPAGGAPAPRLSLTSVRV